VARVFLGETAGRTEADLGKLSVEAVRHLFADICNEPGYPVPATFEEEMGLTVGTIT
jgi:hypothetical protein